MARRRFEMHHYRLARNTATATTLPNQARVEKLLHRPTEVQYVKVASLVRLEVIHKDLPERPLLRPWI